MTLSYLASFDISDLRNAFLNVQFIKTGGGNFTVHIVNDVANAPVADLSVNTVVFNHYTNGLGHLIPEDAEQSSGPQSVYANQSWGALFQQRMRQIATAAGWADPNSLTCAYNLDTQRYTFGYSGTFTNINFGSTSTHLLFGFSGSFSGSSSSVVGNITPSFVVVPSLTAVTTEGTDGYNYEPSGISMQAMSEYGSVFGLTRPAAPLFRGWTQQSEPKSKALRLSASGLFSHQELFEKSRSVHPFVVRAGFGDGKDYVFKLRADACTWSSKTCKRAGGETDDALFDIVYNAQVLGVIA